MSSAPCECHRVLKKGGPAIYQVPFIWHLHDEPRDFYCFSQYARWRESPTQPDSPKIEVQTGFQGGQESRRFSR